MTAPLSEPALEMIETAEWSEPKPELAVEVREREACDNERSGEPADEPAPFHGLSWAEEFTEAH